MNSVGFERILEMAVKIKSMLSTDLTIHDFELHELFNSPKNMHLKALLYLNTDSKTQNVEKISLDLIFYYNFW